MLLNAQETLYGPGYQTVMLSNPAFAGAEGAAKLRISYLNFYPGKNFGFNTFYLSYDSFFPSLHGGAAAYVSNDNLGGIMNDLKGGIAYSYHFQAFKDVYINAGLSASFYRRGFNGSDLVFPDQIDPLGGIVNPTSQQLDLKPRTVFDAGAGFLVLAGRFITGFSVRHLTAPDLSEGTVTDEKLSREAVLHASALFQAGKNGSIDLRPMLYGDFRHSGYIIGGGCSAGTGIFSVSGILLVNRAGDIDLSAGLSLSKGAVSFFYNYCFNLSSGNNLLPTSLYHNAGMVISLNNVEKRKTFKTIIFPKC